MLSAAAKVNLALEVLGRRDDGYHEIATVMQAVDLSDRLVLEDADALELRTQPLPTSRRDGTNLALRAAVTLREAAGVDRGVRITLDKRIPVAAGLGGGSTDAAAVLRGVEPAVGAALAAGAARPRSAVTLGMDVPFFLRGGAALGTGRGERLEPARRAGARPGARESARAARARPRCTGGSTPAMYSDGGPGAGDGRRAPEPAAEPGRREPLQWARARGQRRVYRDVGADARRRCWRRARWARRCRAAGRRCSAWRARSSTRGRSGRG